jgi:hypothetical protein
MLPLSKIFLLVSKVINIAVYITINIIVEDERNMLHLSLRYHCVTFTKFFQIFYMGRRGRSLGNYSNHVFYQRFSLDINLEQEEQFNSINDEIGPGAYMFSHYSNLKYSTLKENEERFWESNRAELQKAIGDSIQKIVTFDENSKPSNV